jgi:hypothetical protein
MVRLVLRLVIFLIPPAATLVFPTWVLYASGEFLPADVFLDLRRTSQPFLVGRAYSDSTGYLKLKTVQIEAPVVIALGTSRVMSFRQSFFANRFFNAGSGDYQQFSDLLAFLRSIPPGREPRAIVVGLDQKFFNARYTEHMPEPFRPASAKAEWRQWWSLLRAYWPYVYRDYFAGKFRLADLTRPRSDGVHRVGLQAVARNQGYREDGSFIWASWEFHELDLAQIASDDRYYVHGNTVSDTTISEVETFLAECQKRGIQVAGFLPPFSPPVYQALVAHRDRYRYVFELDGRLRPIFNRYGFSFADFTDPSRCDIQRDGFYDGQHASEAGYRRMLACWENSDDRVKSVTAARPASPQT